MRTAETAEEGLAAFYMSATVGTFMRLGWTPGEIAKLVGKTIAEIELGSKDPKVKRAVKTIMEHLAAPSAPPKTKKRPTQKTKRR